MSGPVTMRSELALLPEAREEGLSELICHLARYAPVDTVLEIGCSPRRNSTGAWVEGLRANPRKPKLYCLDVSEAHCTALRERWKKESLVECLHGSSVTPDQFATAEKVAALHRERPQLFQGDSLEQALERLCQEMAALDHLLIPTGVIRTLKATRQIKHFGAVLVHGSDFTGDADLDEVYGAEYILLDGTQTAQCHSPHQRLLHDPGYELIAESCQPGSGYAAFQRRRRARFDPLPPGAPIHFFTIVLNGEPFIRHHLEIFSRLSFRWHWHIVEGAAELIGDTAWSKADGGRLPDGIHTQGLSIDGTTAYLDALAAKFPENITIHRPPPGTLWQGKTEMVNQPLKHIFEDVILWQVDSDELWTTEQLESGRRMFLQSPEKTAAYFWCHFFTGERLVVSTRNCYSQNPTFEWLRAWSYRPGMRWLTHEPPALAERHADGTWENIALRSVFTHDETEALGLVFQHFAYVTEEQVRFKELYYGYNGAEAAWKRLQASGHFPVLLKDAFPWVKDLAMVNTAETLGVEPLAQRNPETRTWEFPQPKTSHLNTKPSSAVPVIVVDAVSFQLSKPDAGRVWMEILTRWGKSSLGSSVWLLDRDGTAPQIPGLRYHTVKRYHPSRSVEDSLMLERTCRELHADVFVSTGHTAPLITSSVVVIHDMIPELIQERLESWTWEQKKLSILHAKRVLCVSHATAESLARLFPHMDRARITVSYPAAGTEFTPPSAVEVGAFREQMQFQSDYLMICGERIGIRLGNQGCKNAALAFRAWSLLPRDERRSLKILCTGGEPELEEELRLLAPDAVVVMAQLRGPDLRLAYAGAVALIYAPLYEGLGLPIMEAMACGCPVITCDRASLPEVAGNAACMVDPWDAVETATTLLRLRHETHLREKHINEGMKQASKFSFTKMAEDLAEQLQLAAAPGQHPPSPSSELIWVALEQSQASSSRAEERLEALSTELKELTASLRRSAKQVTKLESKPAEEQKKRMAVPKKARPLKLLWDKIRRKLQRPS